MANVLQAHLLVQQLDAIPTPSPTATRMLELALDPEMTAVALLASAVVAVVWLRLTAIEKARARRASAR
jgi:hypothetical protein